MINRFLKKWRDPKERRLFYALLGGKMGGVALLFLLIAGIPAFFGTKVYAAEETVSYINPINTMWTLIAAFLVFFMQSGFMMLEAGFARSRETINILLEGIVDTCLCGILFWAWGFGWMFGAGNGLIGNQFYFLHGIPDTYGSSGVATLAFFLFQFAFADCTSTITSGAMVGRTGFIGDLLYSFVVSGFIYPILGHWAWGPDGWLALMQPAAFRDFAGSTVIHTIGGMIALAGAIALGPRLGRKFKRDGGGPMPGHDMTIAAVGTVILWFGWYGFNPGSTLSAMDLQGIGRVATNTTLAACAGGLSALFFVFPRTKIWDCGMTCNGILAGLVAITCPCYWVSPGGSIIIGVIAGVLVVLATDLLEHWRIDDPVGAWPVHGINGIWGTISLGLFATGQYGLPSPTGMDSSVVVKGLFYGGGMTQLMAQTTGNVIIGIAALVSGLILMYAVKATGHLRVSTEGELQGLDVHEHGGSAYPELEAVTQVR
ncbi:MAG TPA: ammonium transporter [Verrucomicrobiae bacterium]|jgi:Amt family ammonium transporter|nr:ammonium transporter [Verrucomicrobiae bacterium]